MKKERTAEAPSFRVYKGQGPQISRSARILSGLQEAPRRRGLILDKKKGFLIRGENEARLLRQHLVQGFKKPIADLPDKTIGYSKTYAGGDK